MPFHAKGRGLLRKMDTTSKAACGATGRAPGPAPGSELSIACQRLGLDLKDGVFPC